jgi:small subunit ribosomal protein S5
MDTVVNNKTENTTAPVTPVAPRQFAGKTSFFSKGSNSATSVKGAYAPKSSFGDRSKNPRKPFAGGRTERVKPEFDQKILNIRRVTRVTKGGKRMSFSVALVAGNKKGSIGVGTGKAGDTAVAIDKAFRSAKKNMINLSLTKTMSIPHDVCAKYCSGKVLLMPAPSRGISAGSAVRSILDLAGIKDVSAKILSSSKNKLNIARATLDALKTFSKKGVKAPAPVVTEVKAEVKK